MLKRLSQPDDSPWQFTRENQCVTYFIFSDLTNNKDDIDCPAKLIFITNSLLTQHFSTRINVILIGRLVHAVWL